MVNGTFPAWRNRELFAEQTLQTVNPADSAGDGFPHKYLIERNFVHWHELCNTPAEPPAWESVRLPRWVLASGGR